jgi:hypothetical protein
MSLRHPIMQSRLRKYAKLSSGRMCTNYGGLSFSLWLVSLLSGLGRWSAPGSVGLAIDLRVQRIMSGGVVSMISTAQSQSSVR